MADEKNTREELKTKLWKEAEGLRGGNDSWDFKHYVLGTIFYRHLSEKISNWVHTYTGRSYADMPSELESHTLGDIKKQFSAAHGYFILPCFLFENIIKSTNAESSLNGQVTNAIQFLNENTSDLASSFRFNDFFREFIIDSPRLGKGSLAVNSALLAVLRSIANFEFGDGPEQLGYEEAFEFLITKYAADAGRTGGDFITSPAISALIAQLSKKLMGEKAQIKIYDMACGSGSLLLTVGKEFDQPTYFGQEHNHTMCNLSKMNLMTNSVHPSQIFIEEGDVLSKPVLQDKLPFDLVVSDPSYSLSWEGPTEKIKNDSRFNGKGMPGPPPANKADFAFILHALSQVSEDGYVILTCLPGILYRVNSAEVAIRKYLIESKLVECVISLPSGMCYGSGVALDLLILSKKFKRDTIRMCDCRGSDFFDRRGRDVYFTEEHIAKIVSMVESTATEPNVEDVQLPTFAKKNFSLLVSHYMRGFKNSGGVSYSKFLAINEDIEKIFRSLKSKEDALGALLLTKKQDGIL